MGAGNREDLLDIITNDDDECGTVADFATRVSPMDVLFMTGFEQVKQIDDHTWLINELPAEEPTRCWLFTFLGFVLLSMDYVFLRDWRELNAKQR